MDSGLVKEWQLDPESEYRFELDPGESLAIKLISGKAEIFGAEIGEGVTYLFDTECRAAVFTWHGCELEMRKPSTEYVSDETTMAVYMNLHHAFEQMRVKALSANRNSPTRDDGDGVPAEPPRVLIMGPDNAGKTTACKILTNYVVRAGQGWRPMCVNVDPGEGAWTVPGTISACSVDAPLPTSSPASPLGSTSTSAPTISSSSALVPAVYWFGHAEPRQNILLMERLIRNLGDNVNSRHYNDPIGRCSGIIVDTPSSFATSTGEKKYALVKACIEAFQINVVLVVGHEKLAVEMQRTFGQTVNVVKVPKSGGVVDLDLAYRDRVHKLQVHNYMYGHHITPPPGVSSTSGEDGEVTDMHLAPLSASINFDDLTIYRIGGGVMAPSSALPVGAARIISELQPVPVDPSQKGSGLLNAVLALLSPPASDENERYDEEVLDLTVSGFLVVNALDFHNKKMTVLAPGQGSLVGRTCLVGSFEWQDQ